MHIISRGCETETDRRGPMLQKDGYVNANGIDGRTYAGTPHVSTYKYTNAHTKG